MCHPEPFYFYGVAGMIPTARVQRGESATARCASKGIVPAIPSPIFSILLKEAAFLEIFLVNDRCGLDGKLSPFLQQTFHVFPNQVRFEIDLIADLLEAESGHFRRVRNN